MKKSALWTLIMIACLSAASVASAETSEYKKWGPRKTESTSEKKPGFWAREAERSGLGGSGSRMGSFFKNLNPGPFLQEQKRRYEERKAAAIK